MPSQHVENYFLRTVFTHKTHISAEIPFEEKGDKAQKRKDGEKRKQRLLCSLFSLEHHFRGNHGM